MPLLTRLCQPGSPPKFCQSFAAPPEQYEKFGISLGGNNWRASQLKSVATSTFHKMATVVPPPSKRQKREELERSRVQQDVNAAMAGPEGSFKARFLDGDGNQVCDVIEVPLADASEKNLSLLLNTLLSRVSCHTLWCT